MAELVSSTLENLVPLLLLQALLEHSQQAIVPSLGISLSLVREKLSIRCSDFTMFTAPTALPTLGDSSLNLKGGANGGVNGGANGLRVTYPFVLVGVVFCAAEIWL
jgi:hypothetical protein